MNQLKIGDPVILTQKNGDTLTKRAALVFGIFYLDGLKGGDGEPLIDVIAPNVKKNILSGSADWAAAVDRVVAVRHASHEDIANGKIGDYYETVETSAPVKSYVEWWDKGFVGDGDPYGLSEYHNQSATVGSSGADATLLPAAPQDAPANSVQVTKVPAAVIDSSQAVEESAERPQIGAGSQVAAEKAE